MVIIADGMDRSRALVLRQPSGPMVCTVPSSADEATTAQPMYNLVSAAAAAGVNRSTVLRAIKGGRIGAQRDATGGWLIEPKEAQ
jgi:hypothetical protein